jgi:cyclopropane-fatty-acyl-phospholipid synthase
MAGARREIASRPHTGSAAVLPSRPVPAHADTPERRTVAALLRAAGVELDGERPWDPRVHDERLFARILAGGRLAIGEAYMDGWWDCDRVDDLVARVLAAGVDRRLHSWRDAVAVVRATLVNAGRRSRAFEIGERHYDLGNDLFEAMLDPTMTYSCGYWRHASDLASAQEAKLDLVCRKLGLRPGMTVLDIGCGWGGFAIFAARRYGVRVVGVTVSAEQQRLATERGRGLPVEFLLQDYRDLTGRFDAIVSIGMFEHVGAKNYETYFAVARRCLAEGGLFLLHAIGSQESSAAGDRWIARYVFPRTHIPSAVEITRAVGSSFVIEDWHNFGAYYDRTLLAWERRFAARWPELRARYDERFRRMWRYYLLSCAGAFRARRLQLWQLVLSPRGVAGGYRSIR